MKKFSRLDERNIGEMLDTHKFLTDFFFNMTGQRKRSLASKYLHFHVPNMFFIYDSRAVAAAGQYAEIDKNMREKLICGNVDIEYMELMIQLFSLQNADIMGDVPKLFGRFLK